jgi:hypothetical protein
LASAFLKELESCSWACSSDLFKFTEADSINSSSFLLKDGLGFYCLTTALHLPKKFFKPEEAALDCTEIVQLLKHLNDSIKTYPCIACRRIRRCRNGMAWYCSFRAKHID